MQLGATRTPGPGAALRTVLADMRQLAALRHPARSADRTVPPRVLQARHTAANTSATPGAGCRKWSGKTLADTAAPTASNGPGPRHPRHRPRAATPGSPSPPDTPHHMPPAQRLHVVAHRQRWHAALTEARRRATGPPDLSATRRVADGEPARRRRWHRCIAALGNVSPRTLNRWRETGKAPRAPPLWAELRIWRSDLNTCLDRLREEPAA